MTKTSSRYSKWLPALALLATIFLIAIISSRYCSYQESFTNNSGSGNKNSDELVNADINKQISEMQAEQEKYLLEQIQTDPNKTQLDKDIMQDLTQQYFTSSDTLPILRAFNRNAQEANPVPGDQLIRDILRDYSRTS